MPPDQLPWDRSDFRKQDRSGSDARFASGGFGGSGQNRWREQSRHPHAPLSHPQPYRHHHNQTMKQRWCSDFRLSRPILPGRGKQGGWHMVPEEAGHGFPPFGSRYADRNLEDENFRPFRPHGDGRYLRNSRENRESFSHKDWRSPSWETHLASSSSPGPGKPTTELNNPKSTENPLTCISNSAEGKNYEDTQAFRYYNNKGNNSMDTQTCLNNNKGTYSDHPLPDSLSGQSQFVMKEKNGKEESTADDLASSHQKSDIEKVYGMTEWKLKWNRSGSMSSKGSDFSCYSSSKSMTVDSIEKVVEVQQQTPTPMNSSAADCVEHKSTAPSPSASPSLSPSYDNSSRKKPRLGWGEGLAMYEKKKVDGPEDAAATDGLVSSANITESMLQSLSVNLLEKSLKVANVLDCASPASPFLVACSSSPGIDEKESIKAVVLPHDVTNLCSSPSITSQIHCEGPPFNLENLDLASIANLSSLINEMVQFNNHNYADTDYVRTTSMNKLLVWKVNVLKELEVTETEIDSLDTELKSLIAKPTSRGPPATSTLIPGECHGKPCEQITAYSTVRPNPLEVVASGEMIAENMAADNEVDHESLRDDNIDSPGSASSKLIDFLPSVPGTFSETPECVESLNNSSSSGSSEDQGKTCLVEDHASCVICNPDLDSVGNMHFNVGQFHDTILASNKQSAIRALKELNKLLPVQQCHFEMLNAHNASSLQRDSLIIKERFLTRKQSLVFKEKVIALKFKVFQHFWREGRILSVSKLQGKSHKNRDLYRTGYKKNRSSSRRRISYSAGSSRKVPAEEVVEYVNELLTDSPFKPCRSTLKMPALILDKDSKMSRFISNNALVEDPCAAEKGRSMTNPWTAKEKEIFIDKLSIFGKEFSKIASFLEHKTIADCIEFYYKNHKSDFFQRAMQGLTKQTKPQHTNYLVAYGKRWNWEANAASLDILGEASAIVAKANGGIQSQQKCTSRISSGANSSKKAPRGDHGPLERSNSLDNEAVAADVLAGICGSLSSEAMSSCITSSVDPVDGYHEDWKCQRFASCIKRPLTPDVTQNVDNECSDESCGEMNPTDWTDEEKSFFIQAVSSYGKDFVMISQCLRTKSVEQCKIFFSKARKCLGFDRVLPAVCNGGVYGVNGSGGGSGTTEDACVVQTGGSVSCIDDSECKVEVDLPPPEAYVAGKSDFKPDFIAAKPVTKNSSNDDDILGVVDDKQAMVFNVDSKYQTDGENGVCTPKPDVITSVVPTDVTYLLVEKGDGFSQLSNVPSKDDNKALFEVPDEYHRENTEGQRLIILSDDLRKKVLDGTATNSAEEVSVSSTDIELKDETYGNVSVPCVSFHLRKECVTQKLSLKQSVRDIASMESSILFSVPIKYQRHSSTDAPSDIGLNRMIGIVNKHSLKVARIAGDCQQQHLSDYPLPDSVDPSQILRGYPVSVQTVKETREDFNSVKHFPQQSVNKRDGNLSSDMSLRKCAAGLRNRIENAHLASQEPNRDHSRPDADKLAPSRRGDVKLFGKILISSHEKANSGVCDNYNNGNQLHKLSHCQPLKFTGDQKVYLDSFQSKVDFSNYVEGFGCWDENRTHTSTFPPLPDSTRLLAKYPAAFSNHHLSPTTLKLDQPLNRIIRGNDHKSPFNSVSIFPSREISNNIADYQLLRNPELQPFTMDMKQSQDMLFSEIQRRNGFGVVQEMQSMVGIDVIGQGGVLASGGQCSGVSDPVTAIKMHYVNAQNISGKANSTVIREDDM